MVKLKHLIGLLIFAAIFFLIFIHFNEKKKSEHIDFDITARIGDYRFFYEEGTQKRFRLNYSLEYGEKKGQMAGFYWEKVYRISDDKVILSISFDLKPYGWDYPFLAPSSVFNLNKAEIICILHLNGKLQEITFPYKVEQTVKNLVTNIFNSRRLILPKDTSKNGWLTEEEDDVGTFRGRYRIIKTSKNEIGIKKKVQDYRLKSAINQSLNYDSETLYTIDLTHRVIKTTKFKNIFYQGPKRTDGAGFFTSFEFMDKEDFDNSKKISDRVILNNLKDKTAKLGAKKEVGSEKIPHLSLAKIIFDLNLDEVSSTLMQRQDELYIYLREDPLRIETIKDEILQTDKSIKNYNRKIAAIIGTIARIPDEEAEAALIDLLTASGYDEANMQSAIHIGSRKEVSKRAKKALLNSYQNSDNYELKSAAIMSYGRVGKNLLEKGQQEDDQIQENLLRLYGDCTTPEQERLLLAAMGNHGALEYKESILNSLESSFEKVRTKAIYALRNFDDPKVIDTIKNSSTKDKSNEIKIQGLKALSHFKASNAKTRAIIAIAQSTSDENTEVLAARILSDQYQNEKSDKNKRALEEIFEALKSKRAKSAVERIMR